MELKLTLPQLERVPLHSRKKHLLVGLQHGLAASSGADSVSTFLRTAMPTRKILGDG